MDAQSTVAASSSSGGPQTLAVPQISTKMSMDSTLPKPRTLVLCFDGTANQYDGDNTNVVKLYSLLKKDITEEQLCYYQPGVGTYLQPGVVSPLFEWCAKIMDEAVAWYLDAHVRGGYTFLMQNYRPGDKICIFGFSRGAYTARALAGFLHKIGLLPKDNPEQVPIAYKLFKRTDKDSVQLAAGFKSTFCRSVTIEFVGVWDTVASVGVLMGKTLPFTTTNTTIRTFRHALSLDEHRAKFQPSLYHRLSPNATRTVMDVEIERAGVVTDSAVVASPTSDTSISDLKGKKAESSPEENEKVGVPPGRVLPRGKGDRRRPFPYIRRLARRGHHKAAREAKNENHNIEQQDLSPVTDPCDDFVGLTDVDEVWFSGCHADVGGGAVTNDIPHTLSDITLHWMVREVVQAQCGIQFDSDALARANIPNSVFTGSGFPCAAEKGSKIQTTLLDYHKKRENRTSLESQETNATHTTTDTHIDAVQPINDELKKKPVWWLLEIIPTSYTYQDGKGNWHNQWSFHLGRGRRIPDTNPRFHVSVKERMQDKTLNYKPRAVWKTDTETYVD